jgi:hypothetical protein
VRRRPALFHSQFARHKPTLEILENGIMLLTLTV